MRTIPDEVWLDLNEEVKEPAFVVVSTASGERVNGETVSVNGRRVSSEIGGDTPPGVYTMSYRIVSADAHTVSGTIDFTVSGEPATPSPTASDPPPSPNTSTKALPDDSSSSAALIVMGFFVIAMLGLVGIIRAGLKTDIEGEEE